jgi:hypothetical protein
MDIKDFRLAQIEQGELWDELKVEGLWVHVTNGIVTKGLLAEMGPVAWAVYTVIKVHANMETGKARPSVARIAELIGMSHDTVHRAINRLVELDLLTIGKAGKTNEYIIQEKIHLSTLQGEPFGVAERPYAPLQFGQFISQLKAFAASGNVPGDRSIQINVTLNVHQGDVVNVAGDQNNINHTGTGDVTIQKIEVRGAERDESLADLQRKVRNKLRKL